MLDACGILVSLPSAAERCSLRDEQHTERSKSKVSFGFVPTSLAVLIVVVLSAVIVSSILSLSHHEEEGVAVVMIVSIAVPSIGMDGSVGALLSRSGGLRFSGHHNPCR